MNTKKIPFSPPDVGAAEAQEVTQTLLSGWITTGPRTKEFEREIAAYCHTEKAVCLNSATACMEMILRVLGVGPGDEVITSAYTYTATASVTCHVGAKVVLVDTAPGSFEMDYDKLADAITEKTKVVIPVDLAGIVCDYDRIFAAVESRKQLFRPTNELQKAFGRSSFLRMPPTLSEQNVRAGSAAKSPISPLSPSMPLKTSLRPKAGPLRGVIFPASTTNGFTNNSSSFRCMAKVRTPWPKRNWEPGSTTSFLRLTNAT